jgi:hypothetical protein
MTIRALSMTAPTTLAAGEIGNAETGGGCGLRGIMQLPLVAIMGAEAFGLRIWKHAWRSEQRDRHGACLKNLRDRPNAGNDRDAKASAARHFGKPL